MVKKNMNKTFHDSKKNPDGKSHGTDKVYDAVFWTEACKLSRYLPMLVNEAFDEHFTTNAKVVLISGKQVMRLETGKHKRRFQDALFMIAEEIGEMVEKTYHFECEIKGKRKIAIRIAEYGSAHAFKSVMDADGGAEMEIPYSAVIFLRDDSEDIDKVTIYIKYPGGRVSYDVPIIKIKDYTLDYIFEKKLLLLVPFYVFSISEKEYEEMERDLSKITRLRELINGIGDRLKQMVNEGSLEAYQKANLMSYTHDVLNKILEKRKNVREGMDEFMGGYIIETEFDRMKEKMDEMEATIAEKEATIAEKETSIAEKDASIAQKDDLIMQLRQELEKYKKNNGEAFA